VQACLPERPSTLYDAHRMMVVTCGSKSGSCLILVMLKVFAVVALEMDSYHLRDHAVCVSATREEIASGGSGRRLLPKFEAVDDLMHEIVLRANAGDQDALRLMSGPWRMSYVPRHLEAQGEGPEEMPEWALACGLGASAYNMLAAQLQSNLARHAEGGGLVLNPNLRLINHACGSAANMELAWHPPGASSASHTRDSCSCGNGHYVLRARRPISADEEVTFSFIGDSLVAPDDRVERQALLLRRWGFCCDCDLCVQQSRQAPERPVLGRRRSERLRSNLNLNSTQV
jgi:hypothetical protein